MIWTTTFRSKVQLPVVCKKSLESIADSGLFHYQRIDLDVSRRDPVGPKSVPPIARTASYLDAVRNAFVAGDIFWSPNYNTYLGSDRNDAEARGEPGNVYNSQGMMQESARSN
jgi:hypothetical protein